MDIPSGIIFLWHGAIVNIPPGYVLCDGNNGTPDLRDKFTVGAGNLFDPGDTGGSTFHAHAFTSDGHSHFLPPGAVLQAGGNYQAGTDSKTDTGTTNTANSLPPYHALAYIMKT